MLFDKSMHFYQFMHIMPGMKLRHDGNLDQTNIIMDSDFCLFTLLQYCEKDWILQLADIIIILYPGAL